MKDLRKALTKQQVIKPGPVEPIALFRSLKIRSGSPIKEIWAPQAEALQAWHEQRANPDVLFQLKTGAGKTLIGLIAAQSLVNETKSRVIYCCATNQLVEQTREKADELGIATATYMWGAWDRAEVFQRALGPVITNYAALFNGKSIFSRETFSAVIFDDAHTAHDAIREAFTLSIDRAGHSELYEGLLARVERYFRSVNRGYVFDTVVEGSDPATVLMTPLFEGRRNAEAFTELLKEHGVEDAKDLLFPWGHLAGRLDRCVMLFDSHRVQFTPMLPPVHTLKAFKPGVRRVYLSATLRLNDEFIRTFGRMPEPVITPGGRAGDSERLFLIAKAEDIDDAARSWAEEATRGLKAIIMVPSTSAAGKWTSEAEIFSSEAGHQRIQEFRKSKDQRLVFVARYDGIDLPDDACRVMVVDGLPTGMSLLDRFFEQHLERAGISDAKIASRFIQLLGRTSRGMSDYGVVFLVGKRLLDWVLPPVHKALLPEHVQKQIGVGERLSDVPDFSARELVEECLRQTDAWRDVYEEAMDAATIEAEPSTQERERADVLARAERKASEAIWDEEPEDAVRILAGVRSDAFIRERSLGAWLLHWQALSSQLAGDQEGATTLYRDAASAKREVGALPGDVASASAADESAHSPQAKRMMSLLQERGPARVTQDLAASNIELLDGDASAGVHEEAIRRIGEYLGYDATRPEKQTDGKGPDDMWVVPSGSPVLVFDAKTRKVNKTYNKDLIGRSAQHALWVSQKHDDAERHHFIVGPRVPATPQSTIPPGLRVITREELARVASEVAGVYDRATRRGLPLFYAAEIELGLVDTGLTWDAVPTAWESVRLDAIV